MSVKELEVTMQMSRTSDDSFRMEITDKASSIRIGQIVLDTEQFVDLMTTRYTHGTSMTLFVDDRHGKQMENRQVIVPGITSYRDWPDKDVKVARYLATHYPEWKPDTETTHNIHRQRDDGYVVTIRRYVEVADGR